MFFIEPQQFGFNRHSSVAQQGEDPCAVYKHVMAQLFGADGAKYQCVGLESLQVYPAREGRMSTLGQTLAYDKPLGNT